MRMAYSKSEEPRRFANAAASRMALFGLLSTCLALSPRPALGDDNSVAIESASPAPPVGANQHEIDAYFETINERVHALQLAYKDARNDDEREEAKAKIRREKRLLSGERERLTTTDHGLVTGGGVLVGTGSAVFIAGTIMTLIGLGEASGSPNGNTNSRTMIIAGVTCISGSLVPLVAGIPMIAVGVHRTPREASPTERATPTSGIVLTWRL